MYTLMYKLFAEIVEADVINLFSKRILARKAFVFTYEEIFPDILSTICSVDKEGKKLMFIKYIPSR